MSADLYHVIEKKLPGVDGASVVFDAPARNSVLETISFRILTSSGTYTPVVIFQDDDGDLVASAIAPAKVTPAPGISYVSFCLGGAERDGPLVLQGTLPVITLSAGFKVGISMEGTVDPSLLEFDARATFLV